MNWRTLRAGLALVLLLPPVRAAASDPGADDFGAAIYRRGVLISGGALQASRGVGARVEGAAAACVNCHQRSGLGVREGRNIVPPITTRYLFRPRPKPGDESDIPYVETMRGDREPYTDATLARAIREGLDSQGRELSYLMPRYTLDDADMAALAGYLKRLDQRSVPGVTATALHFATIITPDADPVKRRGMLDVMKQFFADRNDRQMVAAPQLRSSSKTSYTRSMYMVHRIWELHVWELTGPEATWQGQLERKLAAQPVFAVISGLAGKSWAPVHTFCEHAALPCLFPNVEAPPPEADHDFYSLYFSRGVLLEADLIAKGLVGAEGARAVKRVSQVYRSGDSGEAGAHALAATLQHEGVEVTGHALARDGPAAGVAEALRQDSGADAVVLWLRPNDVAALPSAPPANAVVFMSGMLGGLERIPLPAAWRDHTRLAYPFDLAERRRVRVDFALGWFTLRHIPIVADQVQADTYLACGLVSETLSHMVDTFVRDYLVDSVQENLEHRILTGYYPRLSLSTNQRFASKGGYLVHFPQAQGRPLLAEGDWLVP